MASLMGFRVSPLSPMSLAGRHGFRVQAQSLDAPRRSSNVLSSESDSVVAVNGNSSVVVETRQQNGALIGEEEKKKKKKKNVQVLSHGVEEKNDAVLEPLWDDGYGTQTVEDYFSAAKEMIKGDDDGSPPRWFCPVECGPPLKNSPTLLFLPGMDGTGLGLILHHKALGKAFEVRCLHIPVHDRTPFEGMVKLVEEAVKLEYASSPDKPIYLVGDSFGGCLALAVAAHNPTVDLVLILANPATSFGRSQLQPLFPLLEAMPDELHVAVPFLLGFIMGDPMKMASVNIGNWLPPTKKIERLSSNLTTLLPYLSELANIIPRDTLLWKLKLLKSAAAYANSRLHSVKAQVLVLARNSATITYRGLGGQQYLYEFFTYVADAKEGSNYFCGKDNMLPSKDEAQRLKHSLQNCKVRNFKDSGHTLLLEDGIGLLTIIRGTCMYRRSSRFDLISDFIPPSMTEFRYGMDEVVGFFRSLTGSVMFSTLEDGKIVRGLSGVPDEGPVIYVGYHNLMGLEIIPLAHDFLSQKGVLLRGIAHPELFTGKTQSFSSEFTVIDWMKIFGAVPVSASNLYKLLSRKSQVLLYPGGAREALHYKGEQYKVIWPDHQEFVRMAARFGATIVPFGAVGEDDVAEILLDYNDLIKIPIVNDYIRELQRDAVKFRDEVSGEVARQDMIVPALLPKIPGRFYYLFGKPIRTEGMQNMLKDREAANQLYLKIKSEVEHKIDYLLRKREEDPYRNIIDRKLYQALYPLAESDQTPTFNP